MFVWVLTVLAVASAAPQLQLQQPLRSQVISSSQPLSGQIITSQQPYTAQIYTSGQPITGQIISSHQIPLAQNYQQVPLNLQTVHSVTPQPITYQNVPLNVQTVQSVTPQPINYNVQSVTPQPINYNVQSIPVNTLNTVSIQPAQRVRVAQVKPVVRTQTIRPAQQIIATTASPLNIQTVQAVQPVQHIVSTPQVQHHIVATPQVQHVVSAPQVQHLVSAPQVRTVQLQQQQIQGVAILRQVQDVQPDGHYTFAFETENGIKAQEEGRTQSNGAEEINVVQGSYSYTAPDGTPISVNYVADENGFRAEGEHIPKPSEAILRSLEYLRSLPDRPEDQEGRYVRDQNGY